MDRKICETLRREARRLARGEHLRQLRFEIEYLTIKARLLSARFAPQFLRQSCAVAPLEFQAWQSLLGRLAPSRIGERRGRVRIRPRLCYGGRMPRPRYEKGEEVELVPDAWERFERALKAAVRTPTVAKSKPKPRKRKLAPKPRS